MNHKKKVFITVDTEHSIGGAFQNPSLKPVGNDKCIFGKNEEKEYGIPLIMDIADEHNLTVIFFVEVLNKYYFGEEETHKICEYIQKRGHEVQLHLHPNYLNFKESKPWKVKYNDNLYSYSFEEQKNMLATGRKLLKKYGVDQPIAFRAGNYGFNKITLSALKETDFLIDSSYNYSFLKKQNGFDETRINDVQEFDGVYEFPITNFYQKIPFISQKTKPLDINGVSEEEIISTLEWSIDYGLIDTVTIIMHSFSFIEPRDIQYNNIKIRNYVIKRFKNLCRYLAENKDKFEVLGYNDLNINDLKIKNNADFFCKMPSVISTKRLIQQVVNRFV